MAAMTERENHLYANPLVQADTKKAFRWKITERNSLHYVNLKQAIEKLETELLFLKDVNIRDWSVLSV